MNICTECCPTDKLTNRLTDIIIPNATNITNNIGILCIYSSYFLCHKDSLCFSGFYLAVQKNLAFSFWLGHIIYMNDHTQHIMTFLNCQCKNFSHKNCFYLFLPSNTSHFERSSRCTVCQK